MLLLIRQDEGHYDLINGYGELSTIQCVDGTWSTEYYKGCPLDSCTESLDELLPMCDCIQVHASDSFYRALLAGYTNMDMPICGHMVKLIHAFAKDREHTDWLLEYVHTTDVDIRTRYEEWIRDYPTEKRLRGYAKEMRRESEYYEYQELDHHRSASLFNRANCLEQMAEHIEQRRELGCQR